MRALFFVILLFAVGFTACETDEVSPVDDQVEDVVGKQGEQNDDVQEGGTNDQQDQNNDQSQEEDNNQEQQEEETTCETKDKVYHEKNGLVTIDFEQVPKKNGWKKANSKDGYYGGGYIYWDGDNYFREPGNGKIVMKIKINNPGTYRVLWRSHILKGDNGTEHNDSWLKFPNADDFYGDRDGHRVYPVGSGKTPHPNGRSADGWFKVYMNGANQWRWQARTSDHDPHLIFVKFDEAGIYTMQVSARSNYHGLDRVVLFKKGKSEDAATKKSNGRSTFDCL